MGEVPTGVSESLVRPGTVPAPRRGARSYGCHPGVSLPSFAQPPAHFRQPAGLGLNSGGTGQFVACALISVILISHESMKANLALILVGCWFIVEAMAHAIMLSCQNATAGAPLWVRACNVGIAILNGAQTVQGIIGLVLAGVGLWRIVRAKRAKK